MEDRKKKDSASIVLPSVRTYRVWTPKQLRAAEAAADNGYMRSIVDICEWILGDDKVRGALEGRVNGFMELPVSFEGDAKSRGLKKAIKALELGEDWDAAFPASDTKLVNYWGLLLGLGTGVLRWKRLPGHQGRDIPVLEFYHPQPLRYDWHSRSWRLQTEGAGVSSVEFGNGVWLGHMPFGTYRPWSLGLWRSLSRWVLLKAYAISDYGRLGESASRNVVETDKDSDSSQEDRNDLARDISKMARDGACVLPPGYSYKLVEASAATAKIYRDQITLADKAIAIAIRGGNLTTDVEGGSRAAAEVQERTGDLSNRRNDAGAWVTTTHDQMLTHWSESNYGDASKAPWASYATEPEEDRQQKAETMVTALDGADKAEKLGFIVDRKVFSDTFGLSGFLSPGKKPEEKPPAEDPKEEESEELQASKSQSLQASGIKLASGDAPEDAQGFIEGIEYTDAVSDKASRLGAESFSEDLSPVLAELNSSSDFQDTRSRLITLYDEMGSSGISETLEQSSIMCHLAGLHAVVRDMPISKTSAFESGFRADAVSAKRAPNSPHKFDEAVEWFRRRVVVSPEEFDILTDRAKAEAFTIGGVTQLNVIQEVFNEIDKALDRGESIEEFKRRVSDRLSRAWGGENPSRVGLIFRNATARAHSAGRLEQLSQPSLTSILPYRLYDAVRDGNTSTICINLDGTILRHDHPRWSVIWPQNHHGCRGGVRAITAAEAKRKGISKAPDTEPAEGFAAPPTDISTLKPKQEKFDPMLWKIAQRKNVAA